MVKIKYGEPYKTSFGKSGETIKAKTIEEVVTTIEKKYKKKEYAGTIRNYSLLLYNGKFVTKKEEGGKYVYDLDVKLKKGDELLFMMLVGGG